MKVWTIKTSECVATIEAHDDKGWALCAGTEPKAKDTAPLNIITGGADSNIILWEDNTKEAEEDKKKGEVK